MSNAVAVAVRVRPLFEQEKPSLDDQGVEVEGNTVAMIQKLNVAHEVSRTFTFDHCYDSTNHEEGHRPATNADVYRDMVAPSVKDVCDGYNVNVLLYGQTGSGKSYTLSGTEGDPGIIQRACEDLFKHLAIRPKVKVSASFIEIYNEQVIDLLDPKVIAERKRGADVTSTLRVREHPELGPFADGKTDVPVASAAEALDAFQKGCKARTVSHTELSPESSRSHGQFCLTLTHGSKGNMSQLSIVDLGGTGQGEGAAAKGRAGKAAAAQHAEGSAINKSLAQLGMVMNALAQVKTAGKKVHVPYRDSTLTWLLKTALGGNSRTVFLAFLSPYYGHYEESVSTLRYAERASSIMNTATTKIKPSKAVLEAEAEAARIAAEEEAERRRRQEEEDAEAARIAAEEEAALAARMAELAAKAAQKKAEKEEEEARLRAEEEARLRAEEEARRKAEEEEARRLAEEEARLKAEEEARRKAEEEEARRKAEEEARRKAEEEALRKAAEEEARRRAEEEARCKAEEEARQRAELEAMQKAEEEARAEAERKRIEMEIKMTQVAELARLRAEEAARKKALEDEARRKAEEEEARRKAELERKRREEEAEREARDAARRAAEEARLKAEEEAKRKAEERRRKIEEQEALTNAPAREAERLAEAERRAREAAAARKARDAAAEDLALGDLEPEDAAERVLWKKLKKKKAEEEARRVEIEKQAKIVTEAEAAQGTFKLTTKLRKVSSDEVRGDAHALATPSPTSPTSPGADGAKPKKKKKSSFELPTVDGEGSGDADKKKKKKKSKGFELPTTGGGDADDNLAAARGSSNPFL